MSRELGKVWVSRELGKVWVSRELGKVWMPRELGKVWVSCELGKVWVPLEQLGVDAMPFFKCRNNRKVIVHVILYCLHAFIYIRESFF